MVTLDTTNGLMTKKGFTSCQSTNRLILNVVLAFYPNVPSMWMMSRWLVLLKSMFQWWNLFLLKFQERWEAQCEWRREDWAGRQVFIYYHNLKSPPPPPFFFNTKSLYHLISLTLSKLISTLIASDLKLHWPWMSSLKVSLDPLNSFPWSMASLLLQLESRNSSPLLLSLLQRMSRDLPRKRR